MLQSRRRQKDEVKSARFIKTKVLLSLADKFITSSRRPDASGTGIKRLGKDRQKGCGTCWFCGSWCCRWWLKAIVFSSKVITIVLAQISLNFSCQYVRTA